MYLRKLTEVCVCVCGHACVWACAYMCVGGGIGLSLSSNEGHGVALHSLAGFVSLNKTSQLNLSSLPVHLMFHADADDPCGLNAVLAPQVMVCRPVSRPLADEPTAWQSCFYVEGDRGRVLKHSEPS